MGLAGPKKTWRGMTAVDVSHHFGFFVHTNYRNLLEKIMVDHRKTYAQDATSSGNAEMITAVVSESGNSGILVSNVESESELVWTPESENMILSKFESEISSFEKAQEAEFAEIGEKREIGDKTKELKTEEEKQVERVQAMVEEQVQKLGNAIKESAEEAGQKLGNAIKESAELLQVGKAFLQNVKVLFENRKNVLDQAKSLAGVVLENVPLGQKKEK